MSSEVQSTGEQRSETNSQTIKHVTIEKVSKRKYTRKAKTDNAAKELVDQMIKASEEKQSNEMMNTVNEIVNELIDVSTTNEIVNEPVNEQLDLTKQQSSLTQKRIIPRFWVKWYPQIDAPQNTRNASTKKSGAIARELMDKMIEEQEKSKTNETHDEQDNKLLDDLLSKFVNETPRRVIPEFFVKWYPVIDVPSDLKNICTYYSTKINDFTFDGSDAFNEYITPDKYCHPYFDFDHIESLDQYESVLKWLDSIDGYSNDAQISTAYNLKFIEHAEKKVSIHVVFYEKRILQADMMELVKMTANQDVKRFAYEINEFVDDSVYKLKSASKNTRQMFRHILPNKCFRGKSSVLIAGKLCKQDDEPFNQIVQCIQDESDVSDVITNWPLVIHKVPSLKEKEKHETNSKRLADVDNGLVKVGADGKIITKSKVKNGKIDDIDYDDNFIVFSKNQMRSLLKKFETTFENLQKTTASLRYSPHSEEFIKECYTEWYSQREHHHNVEGMVNKEMKYFKQEFTNKWFYSIIKHLSPIDQQQYKNEHKLLYVDKTININNSEFDINDVKARQYKLSDFNQLINDLRGVVGVKDGTCNVKIREKRQFKIEMKSEEQIKLIQRNNCQSVS